MPVQRAHKGMYFCSLKKFKGVLEEKGIGAWIDLWGKDVNHDWSWWRIQLPYFLENIL